MPFLYLLSLVATLAAAQDAVVEGWRWGYHVFANPAPVGQSFVRWDGDAAMLAEPLAWHTTLLDITGSVRVRAVYSALPALTQGRGQVNGSNYMYAVPAGYKAVVFRFHGSGGSADNLFTASENDPFNRTLLMSGYAVLALDSADRNAKQWNPQFSLDNPDVRNVQAAIADLSSKGILKSGDILFASGVSNGGGFTSRVAALLRWRGAHYMISSGIDNIVRQAGIPSIWGVAEMDTLVGPAGNQQAWANYRALLSAGVRAEFGTHTPSPIYPGRFERIAGVTPAQSAALQAALASGGYLDADGLLAGAPPPDLLAALPAASRSEVQNQLASAAAIHQAWSEAAPAVAAFFDKVLANAPLPDFYISAGGNFEGGRAAANSILTLYGAPLTPGAAVTLGADPLGTVETAGQFNAVIPVGQAPGVSAISAGGKTAPIRIARLAPAIYTANGDAHDVAAGQVIRVRDGGVVAVELTFQGGANGLQTPRPILLGRPGEQVALVLYGTGLRSGKRASLRPILEGGVSPVFVDAFYAGETPGTPGLDQINFLLPASWAAAGQTEFAVVVDGLAANNVILSLRAAN